MIRCKEILSVRLTYGPIITKLLVTLNIDMIYETEDFANHMIIALRQIKVLVKHGKIQEDSTFKEEEEEEELEEGEDTKIDKVLKTCQILAEDMKKIMVRDDDTYGIE